MNGECKSFRLNDPMDWNEFKSMPDDIKITYIKLLRQKYNVPDAHIYKMMGTNVCSFSKEMNRLGLAVGKRSAATPWDKEGFYAWWHGVDVLPTPVAEDPFEEPAEDPILEEVIISEEPEAFVEDDLPFEEPNVVPVEKYRVQDAQIAVLNQRIEELLKSNEELMKRHECDRQVIDKLRLVCSEYEQKAQILEAQMDVVRLIFGGKNNV